MRNVIEVRRPLGSVPIEDIQLNAKSRDDSRCALQNIRDNVEIMTPELLGKVNGPVVGTGHKIAGVTTG